MTTLKTLNIVGCGRVGKTLGALFHQQRVFQIGGVMNRTLNAARESIAFIGAGAPVIDLSSFAPADVWLLATSDRVLDEYAGLLASSGALRAGDTLFHCSGALPSAILKHPIISGAYYTASVHPVLTFAEPSIARRERTISATLYGEIAKPLMPVPRREKSRRGRSFAAWLPISIRSRSTACGSARGRARATRRSAASRPRISPASR